MDSKLDSTSGVVNKETKDLRRLKRQLFEQQLVDVWRIQHPSIKDYTYHSIVHGMHSRLGYIMIEHRALEEVMESTIETATLSDHAPVTMKLKVKIEMMGRGAWRVNEDILEDQEVEKLKEAEVGQYFLANDGREKVPRLDLCAALQRIK